MNGITEVHPFGDFIPNEPDKLIIGSFPCYNGNNYGDWFYCGSGKNEFWKLLSKIYKMPINCKKELQELSSNNGIAITDIANTIERTNDDCKDSSIKIIEYNKKGIEKCLKFNIKRIFFTSKYVEKHFKEIFPDVKIPSFILLSPSPSANIYIASIEEYKSMIQNNEITSPFDYRLIKYKKLLGL